MGSGYALRTMAGEAAPAGLSYDAYLALERDTQQRYEWLDGQVYAMAGGTLPHAALSAAMLRELGNLAQGCGCVVFSSDAKVRVEATGLSTYPDGSVVCGPIETSPLDRNAMTNPTVLVEVLSDSTERYDRGEKWAHYRRIPGLRHFLLVSQYSPHIELYDRTGDSWLLRDGRPGDTLRLEALGGEGISVDRVYAGITLEAPPPPVSAGR